MPIASDNTILKSETAGIIMMVLARDKTSYPTRIAREMEGEVGWLSAYFRRLEISHMIKKSHRDKAQHYEINLDGLAKHWEGIWGARLLEAVKNNTITKIEFGVYQRLFSKLSNNKYFKELLRSLFLTLYNQSIDDTLCLYFSSVVISMFPEVKRETTLHTVSVWSRDYSKDGNELYSDLANVAVLAYLLDFNKYCEGTVTNWKNIISQIK
ncbi:MAG: hypothetical protein WCT31_03710 [Candidatus Micrarchaeia archaeon]|jgi:hypothetical protein